MTKNQPTLGDDITIDVDRLLVSRLLVQANSGGGKSYAIRRLLEQTFGHVQHIVLDPEGEFHTLRERYDYVLAGKGGEAAATLETAPLLAIRLLELGVSAIIDISELGQDKPAFVAKFLDALIGAPRELWHPVLVVVDEAHKFCPEKGKARKKAERVSIEDSSAAVIALMDSGRKRGFCGVLATQRVSKLNKDATAECNNKLIGRSVELDAKRAAEELGLASREAMQQLRKLRAGQFYAFGPALSDEVRLMQVGPVETTHPEAGRAAPPPTPPRAKVREVLGQLDDLPAEAAQEARTSEQLRARVRQLESEVVVAKRTAPAPEVKIVEKRIITDAEIKRLEDAATKAAAAITAMSEQLSRWAHEVQPQLDLLGGEVVDLKAAIHLAHQLPARPGASDVQLARIKSAAPKHVEPAPKNAVRPWPGPPPTASTLVPAQQRILDTIATLEVLGVERSHDVVAAWLGTHPRTKGLLNNLGALRSGELLDGIELTATGRKAARARVPKSNAELREWLLKPLKPAQRRIIEVVDELGTADNNELAEALGVHPRTKSLLNNIGALRGRALLTKNWPVHLERVFQVGAA